ncbi:hypothetical protein SELMODRAFT_125041 [Selaginella moellendorffii]|uniref:amino-acid N-acetyltransferase n=1 Tax=Selaginella moellendorffii TaxID=88036 RepID=D8SUG6_SELML|nr:hypothetical protein SELMODRAFT_125041 [Selaginella moellendorffii]
MDKQRQYVSWFREAWPYIQGHRGSTFVIVIPGEVIANRLVLDNVLQDISLLHGLGIKLVIVPGTHIQIDALLRERGKEPCYIGAYRVTDSNALEASMEAAGKILVDIEAKLSRGPMVPVLRRHGGAARAGLSVAGGNFLSAKRRGVVNGVDFGATGEVKKLDIVRIKERLDCNCIVILSNLGYSSSGDVLNCNTYEVATSCATALTADKLLCLVDGPIVDEKNSVVKFMTLEQADQAIRTQTSQSYTAADYVKAVAGAKYSISLGLDSFSNGSPMASSHTDQNSGFAIGGRERQSRTHLSELAAAVFACRGGVTRVHLLDCTVEGAILLEFYTRDGIGTMISNDMYEGTRSATSSDILGIQQLLRPLEEHGILVHRSKQQAIDDFIVVERDGCLIACAALFPYPAEKSGEVAAFAVAPECRGHGQGDSLLDYIERKAARAGLEKLFLLTTRTADWFVHRGFSECTIDDLPAAKRSKVNLSRGSKYYMKILLSQCNGILRITR